MMMILASAMLACSLLATGAQARGGGGHGGGFAGGHMGGFAAGRMANMDHGNVRMGQHHFLGGGYDDYGVECPNYPNYTPDSSPYVCTY
jgi:hypothetical protein